MRTCIVAWRVTDLDRSLGFYTALGYVELGRVIGDDGESLVVLKFPDEPVASLELVHRPADGPVDVGSGIDHLAIHVDALVPQLEMLASTGLEPGPVQCPAGADGPKTSWLTDPDGYRIELVEWPPGHPPGISATDFDIH